MRYALFAGDRSRLRVKVCCIATTAEADLALEAGADALGIVSAMPSGPGPIPEADIRRIVEHVGDRADTVLLTSQQNTDVIIEQITRLAPSVVQICDALAPDRLDVIRNANLRVTLMPVLHVPAGNALADAMHMAPVSDALLLDSGNPGAAVKELGGTGRLHDWTVSRAIVDTVGIPVFLAGGLNGTNVEGAVRAVRPFGVDVCSGVRTDGKLDERKLADFMNSARRASESAGGPKIGTFDS